MHFIGVILVLMNVYKVYPFFSEHPDSGSSGNDCTVARYNCEKISQERVDSYPQQKDKKKAHYKVGFLIF